MLTQGSSPLPQPRSRTGVAPVWFGALLFVVAATVAIVLVGKSRSARLPVSDRSPTEKSTESATSTNPGYLGPQACASCHADRVAEFQQTNHFLACRPPNAKSMPAGFTSGSGTFLSRDPALRFEMQQMNDEFVQTAIHSLPTGEQRTTSRIDLVFGAAPNDEIYFSWHGDRLNELPIAWLHPQNQWGASLFDPHGAGDFSRDLGVRCLECHNTWVEHVLGTHNQYKREHLILGVTCERCHGPGRDHVNYHQLHPNEKLGQHIIKPAELTRELSIDLCAQCHSNAVKYRGPAFSYRPGRPLDASFRTLTSHHREDDHVANQVQYLRQSRCFQHSETMTCVTCHDPHRREEKNPRDGTAAEHSCSKCHQLGDCRERTRLPVAVQNDCVGCHMPSRNKIQVFFATENDSYVAPAKAYEHQIGVYPIAQQEVLLAWYRTQEDDHSHQQAALISKTLTAHWLDVAERCRREFRFLAAIDAYRQAERLAPSSQSKEKLQEVLTLQASIDTDWFLALSQIKAQRYTDAIETLQNILARHPNLAKVHGKLGMLYAATGQQALAVEHLQKVNKYDPDDPYGEGMLGWMAYLDGRFEQAIGHYLRANNIEPYHAKIQYQIGLARVGLEQWKVASDHFRQVLAIDPNHAKACEALSQALRRQGQVTESLEFALRSAQITDNQDPGILLNLAEIFTDAKRFKEADETLTLAQNAAQRNHGAQLTQTQRRIEQIRSRIRRLAK